MHWWNFLAEKNSKIRRRKKMKWKKPRTMPRDESRFLVLLNDLDAVTIIRWTPSTLRFITDSFVWIPEYNIKGWMPLPSPKAVFEDEEEDNGNEVLQDNE